jgi:hypothetical protein
MAISEPLKTNDQVNRDAASVVPTSIPATTAAPVQRIVRPNLFTVWSWNKSTHQYQSYLESVETVYSCDFLNLLWMKSRNARLPDQIEPIARFVCRKEIYDSGCGGVLSQLEEILMEIYPDSFLFQADQDSLEYSEFAPQPLCQGDLEVWLAQIRYSYHRIALEIDNHPEESIHDICRLFPCQKLHKTSGTSDDDVAKLRGDQAWLSLRYRVGANDQVNRDAASGVPTSETTNGGSGSTPCSFSATDPAWIKFRDQQIDLAVKTKGFEQIVAKPEYSEEIYKRDRFVPGAWATELFQEVIDRYKLECGVGTNWSFKIDEWNFIVATLHLDDKWC